MPELPEVEAARRLLERGCVGKRIEKVVAANDEKVFEGASPEGVRRALEGRRVVHARRKGKYLWLQLDQEGPWPLLHFGMTGGIVVQKMGVTKYKRIHLESDPDEWPPRFTKLELDLEGGGKLAFVDSRRFARVKLLSDPPSQEPISRLGFDVMDELPPLDQFAVALRQRVVRAPTLRIKALLLDQEFCSGIGNWVGDEVLYQARIHPEQPASSLDDTDLAGLHAAIRSVVAVAVEAEADSERFPRSWLFHYRWTNKKPSAIDGHKIEFVTVGSRTSAFVPALQKLKGGGGAAAATKASRAARKRGGGSAKVVEEDDEEDEDEEEEEEDAGDSDKGKAAAPKRGGKAGGKRAATARAALAKAKKRKEEASEEEQEASEEVQEASEASGAEDEEEASSDGDEVGKKRARGKATGAAAKKKKAKTPKAAAPAKKPATPRGRKAKA